MDELVQEYQRPKDDGVMRGIKAMGAPPSNRMPVPPPMAAPVPVQSFDLTRNSGPSRSLVTGDRRLSGPTRSLVTGDRSLTRNPNGRMGMPQMPGGGQSYGKTPAAGYSGQRLNSFGQPFQGNKIRGVGYRDPGQRGYGQPQAAPQGYGQPAPGMPANNNQPLPAPLDPLANLPPPATTEQALGMPSYGSPAAAAEANTEQPLMPPLNLPWTGQPLPGGVPMGQLPPSTMNGATGVPPPPAYSMQQVGGFNVLTGPDGKGGSKFLNAYTDPNRGGPTPLSAGEMGRIRAAGYAPAEVGGRSFDAQGVPYLQPLPPVPVPTERVTESPTGTTRTYTQPRGTQPAAPTVSPQDRVNKLMEKAGMPATASTQTGQMPATPTASTQTGQMPATPTASTQTGQMPAVLDPAMADELKPLEDVLQYYRERGTTYGKLSPEARQRMENGNNRLIAQTEAKMAAIRKKYSITPEAAKAQAAAAAQLLDEARNEYARTGNDAALRQYFAQYPTR
jgi:hypothetical protein